MGRRHALGGSRARLAAALGLGIAFGGVAGGLGAWAWLRPEAPVAAETLSLEPASFASLPGWAEDDPAAALPAFLASCARLRAANPRIIPRNHQVEAALTAANAGDLAPFEALLAAIRQPFSDDPMLEPFGLPAPQDFGPYVTFCGT